MTPAGGTIASVMQSSPRTASVGATSAVVLPANPGRDASSWVNSSTVDIYLGLGAPAVVGCDLYLKAGGGAWDGMIGPLVWTGSVTAIAVSGSGNTLCVVEV